MQVAGSLAEPDPYAGGEGHGYGSRDDVSAFQWYDRVLV